MHKPDDRALGWVMSAAPAAIAAVVGIVWIAAHAEVGRGLTHTAFQIAALAENVVALALCRRKPAGALASILVVYLAVDLPWVTGLPVLLALANLVIMGGRRSVAPGVMATTVIVIAMPYVHGDHPTLVADIARILALGAAGIAGTATARFLEPHRVKQPDQIIEPDVRHCPGKDPAP